MQALVMLNSITGWTLEGLPAFQNLSFLCKRLSDSPKWCSLVQDAAAIQLLDKDVYLAEPACPDVYFGIGNSNLYVLHGPHQVIHQALAVIADDIDHAV